MRKHTNAVKIALASFVLCTAVALAQSQNQPSQSQSSQDSKTSKAPSTKKAANPKKPAEAKNGGDPDKVKTDERMSTRGLKPPPKEDDKQKAQDNPPKT
jgi:hypothetical protein